MTSSWVFRIGVALIAIAVVGGIATGFARGWDWDDDRTVEYRLVNSEGEDVRGDQPVVIVEQEHDLRRGGFFPVFPLVFLGGLLIIGSLVARRSGPGGPRGRFDDWHSEAHRSSGPDATAS